MNAYQAFYTHLNAYLPVDEEAFHEIRRYFERRSVKKKEMLQEAGHPCESLYFVGRGCLHMFFLHEKGTPHTVQFALENWWLTDFLAFRGRQFSQFYIQAVLPSEVLRISHSRLDELLTAHPLLERYFRSIYEIAYGSSLRRVHYLFNDSKEEMYLRFREQYPEFIQKVPQYLLASFLGLTPEYLSEIKAKHGS